MSGPRRLTLLAFLVAALCCLARLGALPLIQPDEGRNAEVAREMVARGAWLVPTYDGLPYLDKPAFYFRVVGLSMAALGLNETAARLPGALAALGVLALVYGFARRSYGERAAALAVLVVGTTPLVIAFARIVIFDMLLAFFVIAAILAGFVAEEREGAARTRWYLLGAACAALGTLTKGPVGFLLPALVLGVFHVVSGSPRAIRRLLAPVNLLVFFAIVLPWFFGVAHQRPDFPYYGLVEESFHRFTAPQQFHRGAPFWYYVPVIAGVFFPWSLITPESLVVAWRNRSGWTRADRLLVCWVLVAVVFFSISQSKLPGYVLTAVVALGLLVARVLDAAVDRPRGRAGRLVVRAAVALAVIAGLAAGLLALASATPGGLLAHLKAGETARLAPATGALTWLLGILAAAAAVAAWRRSTPAACAAFALPPLLLLTVGFGGARTYAESASARRLAERLPALPPASDVACLQCLPNGLPFYLRRGITVVTRDGSETTSNYVVFLLKRVSPWPDGVVPLAALGDWLAARRGPVYLLADAGGRSRLDSIAASRSAAVDTLTDGWWGTLLPAPVGGGR